MPKCMRRFSQPPSDTGPEQMVQQRKDGICALFRLEELFRAQKKNPVPEFLCLLFIPQMRL